MVALAYILLRLEGIFFLLLLSLFEANWLTRGLFTGLYLPWLQNCGLPWTWVWDERYELWTESCKSLLWPYNYVLCEGDDLREEILSCLHVIKKTTEHCILVTEVLGVLIGSCWVAKCSSSRSYHRKSYLDIRFYSEKPCSSIFFSCSISVLVRCF